MFKRIGFIFAFLLSFSSIAQAQFRGVTVGHALTTDQVRSLKDEWGVEFVVLPIVIAGAETKSEAQYFDALDDELDKIDALLPTFEEKGIKIFLKLYSPPGGHSTIVKTPQHAVFKYPWATTALVTAWQVIATRFQGSDTIIGYHILNEPAPGKKPIVKWAALARRIHDTIRAVDPGHIIGVSTEYGNPVKASSLKSFISLPNVWIIVHGYYQAYCQQGLGGRKALAYSKKVQKKYRAIFKSAVSMKKKGAHVAVLEFSVVNWAVGADQFVADATAYFNQNGLDWAFHSLYETSIWDPTGAQHGDVLKAQFAQ